MNTRAAHRYAKALMELGNERNALERVASDLASIEETLTSARELRAVLQSPIVKPEKQLTILKEVFGKVIGQEVQAFMALLVNKGRANLLFAVAKEFHRMLDEQRHIISAHITSATELTEEQALAIQAQLERMTGKRIRPRFTVDPKCHGGFRARLGDTLIDATIAHQLDVLRQQLRTGGSPVLN